VLPCALPGYASFRQLALDFGLWTQLDQEVGMRQPEQNTVVEFGDAAPPDALVRAFVLCWRWRVVWGRTAAMAHRA
jgi:hypothetical protein